MTVPVTPWPGFRDQHRATDYWVKLRAKSAEWQTAHPDEAEKIIGLARAECGISPSTTSIRTGVQVVLDSLILERIRALKGWPTEEEYRRQNP